MVIEELIARWQGVPYDEETADCAAFCADYAGVELPACRVLDCLAVSALLGEPREGKPETGDVCLVACGLAVKLGYASAYATMTPQYGLTIMQIKTSDVEAAWPVG